MELTINSNPETLRSDELLVEVINRGEVKIPQVCYHPQLGPIPNQLHNHGAFELLRGALKLRRSCG
jgi:predicted molibdopterin-dependent oxidoreductase YjgC